MGRHKDGNWNLGEPVMTWEEASVAVLMDIRDELKQLNRIFACPNFQQVPRILKTIRANTTKRKRKRAE